MATLIGFDSMKVAILDDNEKVVKGAEGLSATDGIFTADAKSSKGVVSAALTGKAPTFQKINGSDQVVEIAGKGTGGLQVVVGVNDLPADKLNKMTGLKKDTTTGAWYLDKNSRPPYCAVELVTHDSKNKKVYIGLYKGMFVPGDDTINSNTDQGEQRTIDSVTFQAVGREKDGRPYTEGYEGDADFKLDAFEKDLFPQTTP